jgi:hypothetical protein
MSKEEVFEELESKSELLIYDELTTLLGSVAAKVRDGKLPPEYLIEYANLTDSPAEEDDEERGEREDHAES